MPATKTPFPVTPSCGASGEAAVTRVFHIGAAMPPTPVQVQTETEADSGLGAGQPCPLAAALGPGSLEHVGVGAD